jgi:hypothetical protein
VDCRRFGEAAKISNSVNPLKNFAAHGPAWRRILKYSADKEGADAIPGILAGTTAVSLEQL